MTQDSERLSAAQRFTFFFLTKRAQYFAKKESKEWMCRCPKCGFERSVWESGGIRHGGRGNKRELQPCPTCKKVQWFIFHHPVRAPIEAPIATFKASPLSPWIIIITIVCTLILLVMPLYLVTVYKIGGIGEAIAAVLGFIWICCFVFTIREYRIYPECILVKHLCWNSPIPLKGISEVQLVENGKTWAIQIFGIGGLFCVCGRYWNKRYGYFSAYLTNFNRLVRLKISNKTIFLSPKNSVEFVKLLQNSLNSKK